MRLPRFSIAEGMALTAVAALDCLMIRSINGNPNEAGILFFFAGLPWLNVLVIGLTILRGKWRRKEPLPFLLGFLTVGWALFSITLALIAFSPSRCMAALERASKPLEPLAEMVPPFGLVIADGIFMAILTVPQGIVAIAGGLLCRRYRLRIERRERTGVAP